MSPWLEIVSFVVMLVGLFGLLVPAFPGLLVIWLTAVVFGVLRGFSLLGGILLGVITLLMVAGMLVDNLVMGSMARKEGAAWSSIVLGMVAGLLGTLLVPPLGGVVAAPVVVLLLEYRRNHNWRRSARVVRSLALGWGLSFIAQFGIGLTMMLLWGWWVWQG